MSFKHDSEFVLSQPEVIKRPVASFLPNMWGDHFLNYNFDDTTYKGQQEQLEELKNEVNRELLACADEPIRLMKLIDDIQRLGIDYHFETQIQNILHHIYSTYHYREDRNIYNVSLCFRLLRKQGYNITSDIFNKFKDDKGNFNIKSLESEVLSLLALHEAAQWMVHGEDILEEALTFTTSQLEDALISISIPCLAEHVRYSLKQELRKGIPRLEAKRYIAIYKDMASHNKILLKLAKLDFNHVQTLHKRELSTLTRWWKDLGLAEKLYFARDRLIVCYLWALGISSDPKNAMSRILMAKVIVLDTVLDDIYDSYGTLDELTCLTDAFERWDIAYINKLPKFMQPCYQAVLDFYQEIEDEMKKQGTGYRVYYAREGVKAVLRGYLKHAEWSNQNYIPTLEEHMDVVGCLVSVVPWIFSAAFVGMSPEMATKQTFDCLFAYPKFFKDLSFIGRSMNDMVGHKFEQERGDIATTVECYMNQHGVTEQETYDALKKLITRAWKDINEEYLRPGAIPLSILNFCVRYAQLTDVLYKDENCYTDYGPVLKDTVTSLLIDPVPI